MHGYSITNFIVYTTPIDSYTKFQFIHSKSNKLQCTLRNMNTTIVSSYQLQLETKTKDMMPFIIPTQSIFKQLIHEAASYVFSLVCFVILLFIIKWIKSKFKKRNWRSTKLRTRHTYCVLFICNSFFYQYFVYSKYKFVTIINLIFLFT
jgi:hypothetical protein